MVYDNSVGPELRTQTRLMQKQIELAKLQLLVSIQTSDLPEEEKGRLILKVEDV